MKTDLHQWKCPRLGCKKEIATYTIGALESLRRIHEEEHEAETKENIRKFELSKIKVNYDKLKITYLDFTFLKTRFIKIDDDMELISSDFKRSMNQNDDTRPKR